MRTCPGSWGCTSSICLVNELNIFIRVFNGRRAMTAIPSARPNAPKFSAVGGLDRHPVDTDTHRGGQARAHRRHMRCQLGNFGDNCGIDIDDPTATFGDACHNQFQQPDAVSIFPARICIRKVVARYRHRRSPPTGHRRIAWQITSASECPSRPIALGSQLRLNTSRRPGAKRWISKPIPDRLMQFPSIQRAFGRFSFICSSRSCFSVTVLERSSSSLEPAGFIGNDITSRILVSRVSSITMRSIPGAMPPCGGAPSLKALIMAPNRRSTSSGG